MAVYMLEFRYTADAWRTLTHEPADRREGIDKLCQTYGGRLVDLYYSFSDVDGVVLIDVPNHSAASAVALTAFSQGHIQTYRMIPLLTAAEAGDVMRKAGEVAYAAPSTSHAPEQGLGSGLAVRSSCR